MKCVILCGGKGIRMEELTQNMSKPLLKIGEKTILEHIMEHYAKHGVKEFILCLGYAGDSIKEYFSKNPSLYKIEMIDTGVEANKAERLLAIKHLIDDTFFVSYGDDLSNVDITKELEFHKKEGKIATLTAVRLPNPYGILEIDEFNPHILSGFKEKPMMNEWVNGGYFIFDKKIFDYIGEGEDLEKEVFQKLTKEKEIVIHRHSGFWKSINTRKDFIEINEMFNSGELYKKWGNN